MKIALVQIESVHGDLSSNIIRHLRALDRLSGQGVDFAIFPELSLLGYEPRDARARALLSTDARLERLRDAATSLGMTIGVGASHRGSGSLEKPWITMLWFGPGGESLVSGKRMLHPDEEPWFEPWRGEPVVFDEAEVRIGVSICYEGFCDAQVSRLHAMGMDAHVISAAKTREGMTKALAHLRRDASTPTLVVNCVGICEGKTAGGGSFAMLDHGTCSKQLGDDEEAILVVDLSRGDVTRIAL